jgi:ABC-type spermidine/putrescine transport system permease subunit II
MSGILQQGYSLGYVIGACVNLRVGDAPDSWKPAFWGAAGASIAVGFIRLAFPESKQFIEAKKSGNRGAHSAAFKKEIKKVLRSEWKMICTLLVYASIEAYTHCVFLVYCVVLMTWFNFYSHSSQDSYTTFMKTQKGLANDAASRCSILMKTGACVGGTIIGWLSQFVGRRRAIVTAALISCFMIPAWILPTTERSLSASGFFMQFFVQGAWGVVPIRKSLPYATIAYSVSDCGIDVDLSELSPVAFRSSFPGLTYQLGNMISSPSAQIINVLSESNFVTVNGQKVEAYGPVMGIATAIIALGIAVTTALGPERRGSRFETVKILGTEDSVLPSHNAPATSEKSEELEQEKGKIEQVERSTNA